MPHHRHAAPGEIGDRAGHVRTTFHLHRLGAGLFQNTDRVFIGDLRRSLIGAERHIHDDQGLAAAAHHRLGVKNHHFHGDADRIGQAVQHHADRIADQQDVAGFVQQRRHRGGVGGQANDGRSALAPSDIARRQTRLGSGALRGHRRSKLPDGARHEQTQGQSRQDDRHAKDFAVGRYARRQQVR